MKLILSLLLAVPLLAFGSQTVFAQYDNLREMLGKILTIAGNVTLDQCTPFMEHRNDSQIQGGQVIGTCAHMLGILKGECDPPKPAVCSDPRYTNWLANDYGKYPVGTWDNKNATGGG